MGRHAGWIAWQSGLAGGANVILIPERPFQIDEVCAFIEHRFASRYAPIVVVAVGALPVEGSLPSPIGGLDQFGHVRLSGICARVLATRFGLHAVDALHDGHFGQMVALHGTSINLVPLSEATAQLKLVSPELYAEAEIFFG